MKNDFLEYYGKHHISPVKQNLQNISIHYKRREKLYRQCGIPILAFDNAEILEIGPGGGYNTLAFFEWNCKHIDLVEANPKGIEDMQRLFADYNIDVDKYKIFPCIIEKYKTEKKYDIIIAEGFLQHLVNQEEIINICKNMLKKNGIIVITCVDDIGLMIEGVKRLFSNILVKNIENYDEKVEFLASIFAPQLSNLIGVSRTPKEWVQDQILNPTIVNGNELSLEQAMEYFWDGFDILGSSPNMFTDYSWYKDIWYDYKGAYMCQFRMKQISLVMANMPELILSQEITETLKICFRNIRKYASQYEKDFNNENINLIIQNMSDLEKYIDMFHVDFKDVFYEIKHALNDALNDLVRMEKYPHFFKAFGRSMQYIAFVKSK